MAADPRPVTMAYDSISGAQMPMILKPRPSSWTRVVRSDPTEGGRERGNAVLIYDDDILYCIDREREWMITRK